MSTRPRKPARIIDWLMSCGELTHESRHRPLIEANSPNGSDVQLKRKIQDMDHDTPRAKRQATGVATPSASKQGGSRVQASDNNDTSSLQSGTTMSRSSSPDKRQREAEIEFSRPTFDFQNRSGSRQWKEKNARQVPPLMELLESIARVDFEKSMISRHRHKLERILKEIEKCKDRSATEEAWSDAVIHPALRLARKLLPDQGCVDIINVIGLEVADHDQVNTILQTVEDHTLAQSNHKMLRDRVLCSHLEIKTERSPDDARFQLLTWCAAGFQKQENLWLHRHLHLQEPPTPILAPIPLWLWKEKNVQLWIAVMDSKNARIYLLDEKAFFIDEEDVESLFRVVAAIAAVMAWGQGWYLPWLRDVHWMHGRSWEGQRASYGCAAPRSDWLTVCGSGDRLADLSRGRC
ncbi:hypothetical protein LTR70_009489 [Exophiala xenobiotica]|uniref:PD-(D/E)XK nuclease-like domain-containing protein n=1 Tax=Lithohypha guttulata TaxID=1690604 RepID=A0ABR0JXH9_9EURO|nr:hypothetical protein LTR24_009385 [Lithohypha guttulata]KAK5310421.1 hypothetical protein LTR70_009489 [Exophiala xenobiotica]